MDFEFKKSVFIGKPVDDVWKILWNEFAGVSKILSNVKECKVLTEVGDVVVDGIGGRELAMMDGSTFTEMLVKVDKAGHSFSYSITGLPFGLTPVGTWTVSKSADDDLRTELSVEDVVQLAYWPPQFLLYPLLSFQLRGIFEATLADIKHYAETGEASPAKAEAMKKISEMK